jgi:hypothetical protein
VVDSFVQEGTLERRCRLRASTVRLLSSGILALGLLHVPTEGNPCSCVDTPTAEESYEWATAVFSGTVAEISTSPTLEYEGPVLEVQINVTAIWKGEFQSRITIATPEWEGVCGYPFQLYSETLPPDTEFLFYVRLWESTGFQWVWLCGRSKPLSLAGEDLNYLGPPTVVPVVSVTWGQLKSSPPGEH